MTCQGDEDEEDAASNKPKWQDREYFDSYATMVIHQQMLSDTPRTRAYAEAVKALSARIRDAVVLDVGCGSGVLTAFCAQAGAKHAFGVDASDIVKIAAAKVGLSAAART